MAAAPEGTRGPPRLAIPSVGPRRGRIRRAGRPIDLGTIRIGILGLRARRLVGVGIVSVPRGVVTRGSGPGGLVTREGVPRRLRALAPRHCPRWIRRGTDVPGLHITPRCQPQDADRHQHHASASHHQPYSSLLGTPRTPRQEVCREVKVYPKTACWTKVWLAWTSTQAFHKAV